MINLDKLLIKQIETRLPAGDMTGIKLRDVQWSVKTAGPSPFNNERTEIFLLGCEKAMSGDSCQGCFNSTTWDSSKAEFTHDPILMAEHINNNAPNKYITIGGGEPSDQILNLIILCRELKKYGFHIMVYTWKRLSYMNSKPPMCTLTEEHSQHYIEYIGMSNIVELLKHIDILVDGQYKQEERLWNGDKADGLISSIGSGNQIVWDVSGSCYYGYAMRDISSLTIIEKDKDGEENALYFETINNNILTLGGLNNDI